MRPHPTLVLVALLLPIGALTASERCGDAADKALFSATSWRELSKWYSDYPECDDGYLAEHVSTLVGEWLSRSPAEFTLLGHVVGDTPGFEDHVARHIDMTLGKSTTLRIRRNAEQCPADAARICRRIIRALDELDEEARRVRREKE